MDKFKNSENMPLAVVIGTSVLLSALIFSWAFYSSRNNDDTLSVTGSASVNVVSDSAKFSGTFTRIVKQSEMKSGYAQIASDLSIVKKFLKDNGIDDKDVTISTVSMYQNYDYNKSYNSETEYTISQKVEVSSSDVDKITKLAQKTQDLINAGVIFSTDPVEYSYSKLPDLRVSLLSDAIADAKARASKIAEASGQKVGSLKTAASGVVQVRPQSSLDISDYGMYDTSTINKNVMITVKAAFKIK